MRKILCCAASAAALIFAANAADTPAPKKQPVAAKPAVKTAPSKTAPQKTSSVRPPATRTTTARSTTASRRPATNTTAAARRPVVTWRNRQASPSTDRYKEIQDALVAKGYLQSDDATGNWNNSSVEAMKRFQAEQNLDSTGRINSLSLIALGLGPKYEAVPAPKPSDTSININQR